MERTRNAIREAQELLDDAQVTLSHLRVTENNLLHEYEHFTGVMLKCGALLEQIMSSLVVNILHNQDLQPTDLTTHLKAMQTLLNEALKHKFEASGSTSMQHKATTLQEEQDIHLVEDSRMQERVTWQAALDEFVNLDEKRQNLEREADLQSNCVHEMAVCSSRMAVQDMYEH